jgi:hypothetical protein
MPLLTVRQLRLDDVFQDMARVALEHRPHTKAGKVIVIRAGGKTARALARGSPSGDSTSIYLDDATRDRLGVSSGDEVHFDIGPAGLWDEFLWGWQATNAVTRVGARLGVTSVALGFVGVILGAAALWVTLRGI